MAGNANERDDDMITGMNLTPFIDVVLVLLVMFMIAAPVAYQAGVKVQLPKSVTGSTVSHVTLRFVIPEDGRWLLEGREVKPESLSDIIQKAHGLDPTADAVVAADAAVAHGKVVALIDRLRGLGLGQVAIGVDAAQKGNTP